MNGSFILLFDKRVEFSNKYKKILEQNHCSKVCIVENKQDFNTKLVELEPDMVLISESVSADLAALAQEIRNENLPFRPVIVLLSKSSFIEDKTNALNAGADDFLSEPMETQELLARINAHLRRTVEENSSVITKFPTLDYANKVIRRTLKANSSWGMLLIGLDNFSAYREIYGELPSMKLLQAYSAILNATIEYDDFVSQISDDKFLIITSSFKAEKLADYLNYAFDSVSKKFYSNSDASRGYILLQGENKAGCKIPIMTTSIGIISSELISYQDEVEVLNALTKVQKLAKTIIGSTKVIDRPLITSEEIYKFVEQKNIVVIEEDADLAYLLETTLKIQGFNPIVYKNYSVSIEQIFENSPSLIILDSGKNSNDCGLNFCKQLKENTIQNIKIIFTDTAREKEQILSAGADLYLPKPYDLMDLFQWIYKLLD